MSEKKTRPETADKTPKAPEEADEAAAEDAAEEPAADAADTAEDAGEGPSGWTTGELDALRAENTDLKDRLLRAAAEMENLRRRTERDKADTSKYAISSFARDVLSIGDNLRRAIEHVSAEAAEKDPALKTFLEGVEMTERELLNVMERHGIQRIDPKGERFDPNQHQAMYEVEDKDVAEGTVVDVLQPGYVINDRMLRPALVGVSRGGAKAPKPQPKTQETRETAADEGEDPGASEDESADAPASPQAANDDSPERADAKETRKDARKASAKSRKGGSRGKVGGRVDRSA